MSSDLRLIVYTAIGSFIGSFGAILVYFEVMN